MGTSVGWLLLWGFSRFFQVFFFYFLLYFGWSRNEKRIYSRQGVAFGAGNMGLLLLLGVVSRRRWRKTRAKYRAEPI